MRKVISRYYSFIFPKRNREEYTRKELIGRAIIWLSLFTTLTIAGVHAVKAMRHSPSQQRNRTISFT